jgi:hypothetical protein
MWEEKYGLPPDADMTLPDQNTNTVRNKNNTNDQALEHDSTPVFSYSVLGSSPTSTHANSFTLNQTQHEYTHSSPSHTMSDHGRVQLHTLNGPNDDLPNDNLTLPLNSTMSNEGQALEDELDINSGACNLNVQNIFQTLIWKSGNSSPSHPPMETQEAQAPQHFGCI